MPILETIAIKTVWGKAWGLFKSVPLWVWATILIAGAWWIDRSHQYDLGRADEREAWEAEVASIRAERAALALVVADQDAQLAAKANQTIEERREELDNAVADIPDQALTDRQRARVCAERLRQGRRCEVSSGPTASN